MRKTLARYHNGNYDVVLLSDGTKIRFGRDGEDFNAEFPESIDLNITDWCDVGCPFCYRGCTPEGRHHAFDEWELKSLEFPAGMEVALGGGSPIRHPDLEKYCDFFRAAGCFPSITVHHSSIMDTRTNGDLNRLMGLQIMGRIHGVGISTTYYNEELSSNIREYLDHGVVHMIAGLVSTDNVYRWLLDGIPVLILGYKNMGRGHMSSADEGLGIAQLTEQLSLLVGELLGGEWHGISQKLAGNYGKLPKNSILSFDNLALKQLKVKNLVPKERWDELYMGDDGVDGELTSASMYMDMVSMTYARNSVDGRARPVGGKTIREMFSDLKANA